MKKLLFCSVLLLIMICLYSCGYSKSESKPIVFGDTVVLAKISLHDTASYSIVESERCQIAADVDIVFPKFYMGEEKTAALQREFSKYVLGMEADTMTLASAFPEYVDILVERYKVDAISDIKDIEVDYEPVSSCALTVKIYAMFNSGGIICFCNEEIAEINEKDSIDRHFYYVFDLSTMKRVRLEDLIAEEYNDRVTELLKNKLRTENDVLNDDELADRGFYNFDNMTVNRNFYVTAEGITWGFLPRELAVSEEVQVSLSYELLAPYLKEQSVVSQYINVVE